MTGGQNGAPAATASNHDIPRLTALHGLMARIRAFERAAETGQNRGLVLGAVHLSIGQEAVAAGVCAQLRRDDLLLSTHRGHGHTLAKGADARAMMLELLGKAGGTSDGRGGSMHIADFSVGMLGANGVVSANIPIAVGAAQAIRLKGGDQVVACLFGDGAINRGPFMEGLNWAKVFNLPVLFVCEDNGWSATTRTSTLTAGEGAAARARSMDVTAIEIDGNDLVAVDEATREAVARLRAGEGPILIHARTYRLLGHTASDPAGYRPAGEAEERWSGDPMRRNRALLEAAGVPAAELDALEQAATDEMTAALDAAEAAPWAPAALALEDVQDAGAPARFWTREG